MQLCHEKLRNCAFSLLLAGFLRIMHAYRCLSPNSFLIGLSGTCLARCHWLAHPSTFPRLQSSSRTFPQFVFNLLSLTAASVSHSCHLKPNPHLPGLFKVSSLSNSVLSTRGNPVVCRRVLNVLSSTIVLMCTCFTIMRRYGALI